MTKSPTQNQADQAQVAHDELSDEQLERVAAGIPPSYGLQKGAAKGGAHGLVER